MGFWVEINSETCPVHEIEEICLSFVRTFKNKLFKMHKTGFIYSSICV